MEAKKEVNKSIGQVDTKPVQKSNKATIFWILGGCLALLIAAAVVIGGFVYWGYKKVKTEAQKNQAKIEEIKNQAKKNILPENTGFTEEPQVPVSSGDSNADNSSIEFPENSERQMGFIKKVYAKNGKNFLDIDYIQWFMGDAAEKAMREDGECSEKGECIVLNDYYIRNQNPLIRTFEISSDAKIIMETYSAQQSGVVGNNQEITFAQFKNIFSPGSGGYLRNVPYIVEISNQQISKITEQYIP